jgi:hypothetical protein
MNAKETVEISSMVGLLSEQAPEKLAALRQRFPEYGEQLQRGRLLGATAAQKARFLLSVAIEATSETKQLAESALIVATRRLDIARRLDFSAQSLSLLASSGTVLLLLQKNEKSYIAAVLSFLASLFLLGTSMYRTGMGGGKSGIQAVHAKLVTSIPELTFLRGRLAAYNSIPLDGAGAEKEALQLVSRAEQLCKDVRGWAAEVPGTS